MASPAVLAPHKPLYTRVWYFIRLSLLKHLILTLIPALQFFKPLPAHQQPTLLKTYPVRKHLTSRVYVPQAHQAGSKLPLYFHIHGGGFALMTPVLDDEWCALLSNTYRILVVSLDYSKAPGARFPALTEDIEALVLAVLADESLPVDHRRVAIGGFSAGGNLALSAVQAPALKGRIHGVVPTYPVVDFVTSAEAKAKTRPYRSKTEVDALLSLGPVFNWGYFRPGQDLTDPRLSPKFARREDLPEWIFMMAAEYDMLCNEAKEMIMGLAGVVEEGEREELKYGFERGTYRWWMVRGVEHGYRERMGPATNGDLAREGREKTLVEMGEWLFKGPFA